MTIYNIYMFRNDNNKCYVGFTSNFNKRLAAHRKKHTIVESNIVYQTTDINHAYKMEEYFIKEYDSYYNGLNKTKDGKGIVGKLQSTTGFRFSQVSRQKMSESAKQRYASGRNPLKDYVHTEQDIKKMSDSQTGICTYSTLSVETILDIKRLYKLRPLLNCNGKQYKFRNKSTLFYKIMSLKYNVSTVCISDIIKNKSYNSKENLKKNAKLSYEDACYIRDLYTNIDLDKYLNYKFKRPYKRVFADVYSKRYNITPQTILHIIDGKIGNNIKATFNSKILTINGYEYFSGIVKSKHTKYLNVVFENGSDITCSCDHLLMTEDGTFESPYNISNNVVTNYGLTKIKSIDCIKKNVYLYDIINAGKNHCYYTNGVISHNCAFLSSKGTLINSEVLESMRPSEPIKTIHGMDFYKDVNRKRLAVAVDVSEGIGGKGDYSTVQVFDIDTLEQMAEFKSNTMSISVFTKHFIKLLMTLDNEGADEIFYTVESNPIGLSVINLLENATHSILNKVDMISEYRSKRKGMLTTNKSKMTGCTKLKDFVENGIMKIHSKHLITELKFFVKRGASFSAEAGMHDDLVMATVIICNMMRELTRYDDGADVIYNKIQEIDCIGDDTIEPLPII